MKVNSLIYKGLLCMYTVFQHNEIYMELVYGMPQSLSFANSYKRNRVADLLTPSFFFFFFFLNSKHTYVLYVSVILR